MRSSCSAALLDAALQHKMPIYARAVRHPASCDWATSRDSRCRITLRLSENTSIDGAVITDKKEPGAVRFGKDLRVAWAAALIVSVMIHAGSSDARAALSDRASGLETNLENFQSMACESTDYDKKSLRLLQGARPDFEELALDCVAFATAFGGAIDIAASPIFALQTVSGRTRDGLMLGYGAGSCLPTIRCLVSLEV
jgi:hypothetical protein